MRKLIIATAALALLSSTAFAQDKGAATPPSGSDSMTKGDMTKDTMSKSKKKTKSAKKKTGDDAMTKQ